MDLVTKISGGVCHPAILSGGRVNSSVISLISPLSFFPIPDVWPLRQFSMNAVTEWPEMY